MGGRGDEVESVPGRRGPERHPPTICGRARAWYGSEKPALGFRSLTEDIDRHTRGRANDDADGGAVAEFSRGHAQRRDQAWGLDARPRGRAESVGRAPEVLRSAASEIRKMITRATRRRRRLPRCSYGSIPQRFAIMARPSSRKGRQPCQVG